MIEDNSLIEQLVDRWQELCEVGEEPTLETFLDENDCPAHLQPKVVEMIELLGEFEDMGASLRESVSASNSMVLPVELSARFDQLEYLDQGGLGVIYRAIDPQLGCEVALKSVRDPGSVDGMARLRREAEITARLAHPGIVPIHGIGQDAEGRPCYVMKLIQGETLADAIRRFHGLNKSANDSHSYSLRELLDRFLSICSAAGYIHSRNVIHRDLKPSNVMLGNYDETLIIDCGLAKEMGTTANPDVAIDLANQDEMTLHAATVVHEAPSPDTPKNAGVTPFTRGAVGSPGYWSPEQEKCDPRIGSATDVYSLGAILDEILTARRATEYLVQESTVASETKRLKRTSRKAAKRAPKPLRAICKKAMAEQPEDRYATAEALADDVRAWLADEPVTAYRDSLMEKSIRWMRRHRSWTFAGISSLILLVIVAIAWVSMISEKNKELIHKEAATREALDFAEAANTGFQRMTFAFDSLLTLDNDIGTIEEASPETKVALGEIDTGLRDHVDRRLRKLQASPKEVESKDLSSLARALTALGTMAALEGNIEVSSADLQAAVTVYDEYLSRFDNAETRREYAVVLSRLGQVLLRSGDANLALKRLDSACDQLAALSTSEMNDMYLRLQFATANHARGDALTALNRREEAAEGYRTSLDILPAPSDVSQESIRLQVDVARFELQAKLAKRLWKANNTESDTTTEISRVLLDMSAGANPQHMEALKVAYDRLSDRHNPLPLIPKLEKHKGYVLFQMSAYQLLAALEDSKNISPESSITKTRLFQNIAAPKDTGPNLSGFLSNDTKYACSQLVDSCECYVRYLSAWPTDAEARKARDTIHELIDYVSITYSQEHSVPSILLLQENLIPKSAGEVILNDLLVLRSYYERLADIDPDDTITFCKYMGSSGNIIVIALASKFSSWFKYGEEATRKKNERNIPDMIWRNALRDLNKDAYHQSMIGGIASCYNISAFRFMNEGKFEEGVMQYDSTIESLLLATGPGIDVDKCRFERFICLLGTNNYRRAYDDAVGLYMNMDEHNFIEAPTHKIERKMIIIASLGMTAAGKGGYDVALHNLNLIGNIQGATGTHTVICAAGFALCAKMASNDMKLSKEERMKLKKEYEDRAFDLINRFSKEAFNFSEQYLMIRQQFLKYPAFNSIRKDKRFQDMLLYTFPHPDEIDAIAVLQRFGATMKMNNEGRIIHINKVNDPSFDDLNCMTLRNLKELQFLNLADSGVTDPSVNCVLQLPNLVSLNLKGTSITDLFAKRLVTGNEGSNKLKHLDLRDTNISMSRIKWLRTKLPQVEILYEDQE